MSTQLISTNIFDLTFLEGEIKKSESIEKFIDAEIETATNRIDHLLEKKRKLKTVRAKIKNFTEVIRVL